MTRIEQTVMDGWTLQQVGAPELKEEEKTTSFPQIKEVRSEWKGSGKWHQWRLVKTNDVVSVECSSTTRCGWLFSRLGRLLGSKIKDNWQPVCSFSVTDAQGFTDALREMVKRMPSGKSVSPELTWVRDDLSDLENGVEILCLAQGLERVAEPRLMENGVFVGDMAKTWCYESDHVPVGALVVIPGESPADDVALEVVSHNVGHRNYMSHFKPEKNTQGLYGSLITECEWVEGSGESELRFSRKYPILTVREERLIDQTISILGNPSCRKDVCGLQEASVAFRTVLESQLKELNRVTKQDYQCIFPSDNVEGYCLEMPKQRSCPDERDCGCLIYNAKKLEVKHQRFITFTKPMQNKYLYDVTFSVKGSDRLIRVIDGHIEFRKEGAIKKYLEHPDSPGRMREDIPLILMGDFNADSTEVARMLGGVNASGGEISHIDGGRQTKSADGVVAFGIKKFKPRCDGASLYGSLGYQLQYRRLKQAILKSVQKAKLARS